MRAIAALLTAIACLAPAASAQITPEVPTPFVPAPDPARSLTRNGITITANIPLTGGQSGQYADGSYWILVPSGGMQIRGISPTSVPNVVGTGPDAITYILNGAEWNPSTSVGQNGPQGYRSPYLYYSGSNQAPYVPGFNVAYSVSNDTPIVVGPDQGPRSLVTTITFAENSRPNIRSAAVWTFVDAAPAAGQFRPPYCGDRLVKALTPTVLESEIDYDLLRDLDKTTFATGPQLKADYATLESNLQIPFLDYVPAFIQRTFHARAGAVGQSQVGYGSNYAHHWGMAMCITNLNFSDADKRDLVVGLVQLGIDLHGIMMDSLSDPDGDTVWLTGGGHHPFRWGPIIYAGVLTGHTELSSIRSLYPSFNFADLEQVFTPRDYTDNNGATTPNNWNNGFGRFDPNADYDGTVWFGNQHNRPPSWSMCGPCSPGPVPFGLLDTAGGWAQDDSRWNEDEDFANGDPGEPNNDLAYLQSDTGRRWILPAAAFLVMDVDNGGAAGVETVDLVGKDEFFQWVDAYAENTAAHGGDPYAEIAPFDGFSQEFWEEAADLELVPIVQPASAPPSIP